MAREEKSFADRTANLVSTAQRVSTQMAAMGLQTLKLSADASQPRNHTLCLFLEGLIIELDA